MEDGSVGELVDEDDGDVTLACMGELCLCCL
jgi:hypothetical protein